MNIVEREVELLSTISYADALNLIETAGRNCYQSFDKIDRGSAEKLIQGFIRAEHGSPLEHISLSFRMVMDRKDLAQITRHRIASFSVESQRYNDYSKDKYGNSVDFIVPTGLDEKTLPIWKKSCERAEEDYMELIKSGARPEVARSVLNNSVACKVVFTANIREIRAILKLRLSPRAQADIRDIMGKVLAIMKEKYPVFVCDFE